MANYTELDYKRYNRADRISEIQNVTGGSLIVIGLCVVYASIRSGLFPLITAGLGAIALGYAIATRGDQNADKAIQILHGTYVKPKGLRRLRRP